jgi:hypothetical protein
MPWRETDLRDSKEAGIVASKTTLDKVDRTILAFLQDNARTTNAEIARQLGGFSLGQADLQQPATSVSPNQQTRSPTRLRGCSRLTIDVRLSVRIRRLP